MKYLRIFVLMLALLMVVGCFSGCGLNKRPTGSDMDDENLEPTIYLIVDIVIKDASGAEVFGEEDYIYIYTESMGKPNPLDILKDYCYWELSTEEAPVEVISDDDGIIFSVGEIATGSYQHPILNKSYNTFWTWKVNGVEIEASILDYKDLKDYDSLEFALTYTMSDADKEALKNTTKKETTKEPSSFEEEEE